MPPQLSVLDLFKNLAEKNSLLLLDVREKWERDLCTLPESLHIPMSVILDHVDSLDPDQEIVVFCHHGYRSLQVCCLLQQRGFDKVQNLAGGIDAWAREIDSKMPLY